MPVRAPRVKRRAVRTKPPRRTPGRGAPLTRASRRRDPSAARRPGSRTPKGRGRAPAAPGGPTPYDTKAANRSSARSSSPSDTQNDSLTWPGAPKLDPGTSPTPASETARSQNSSSPIPVPSMLGNA